MAEEVDPHLSSAVIKAAFDQDAKHGRLSGVDVANYGNSRLNHVVHALRTPPYNELAADTAVFGIERANLVLAAHVARHEQPRVGVDVGRGLCDALERKVPVLAREAHRVAIVLEAEIEEGFAVALEQAAVEVARQLRDALVGRRGVAVEQDVLELDGARLVGEAQLIEDLELLVLLLMRGLRGRGGAVLLAALDLLFLDVLGKVAQRLRRRDVN